MEGVLIFGLLAFALLRRRGQGHAPSSSGPGPASLGEQYVAQAMADQAELARVVGDVKDTDWDWLGDAVWDLNPAWTDGFGPMDGAWGPARYSPEHVQVFLKQLWLPASRVTLSSLTQKDLEAAQKFLTENWPANANSGAPMCKWEQAIQGENDRLQASASVSDGIGGAGLFIVGAIAPVFKQAAEASDGEVGLGAVSKELRKGMVTEFAPLKIGQFLLKPDYRPDAEPMYRIDQDHVESQGRIYGVRPGLFGYRFAKVPDTYLGNRLVRKGPREPNPPRLFPAGWLLPWISEPMGSRLLGLREKVYRRARMLRALDLLACLAYPAPSRRLSIGGLVEQDDGSYAPGALEQSISYSYDSTTWGPIRGSMFPPAPGDRAPLLATDAGQRIISTAIGRPDAPPPSDVPPPQIAPVGVPVSATGAPRATAVELAKTTAVQAPQAPKALEGGAPTAPAVVQQIKQTVQQPIKAAPVKVIASRVQGSSPLASRFTARKP
jgi:hypothetical protein